MKDHGHSKPVFGCNECIFLASRGSAPVGEVPNGWKYYRIEATKTMTSYYYVLAPSRAAAEADAEEIVLDPTDYEVDDDSSYVMEVKVPPTPGEPLWTGGPGGEWTSVPREVVA